jgi:hypothetical protein
MTVSAIPYAIITLFVFSLFFMSLGLVFDELGKADNEMMHSGLPYSHQRAETVNVLALAMKAMALIAIIIVFMFLIMNGVQKSSGDI